MPGPPESGGVRWDGDRYRRAFAAAIRKRVAAAAVYLAGETKQEISRTGVLVLKRASSRDAKGRFLGQTKRIYNFAHSLPGDPPFKQTGRLRGSIAWEQVDDATARVGTNLVYGRVLETRLDRPYLTYTLAARREAVARIITRQVGPGELPSRSSPGPSVFRSGKSGRGATRSVLSELAAQTSPLGPGLFRP